MMSLNFFHQIKPNIQIFISTRGIAIIEGGNEPNKPMDKNLGLIPKTQKLAWRSRPLCIAGGGQHDHTRVLSDGFD